MKKDLQSYFVHNKEYENLKEFYAKDSILQRIQKNNEFNRNGFGIALALTKNLPDTHIDVGSGVGWLIREIAPYFKKSIGIEPSHAANLAAQEMTKEFKTVSFVEKDMLDAYDELQLSEPAFFTTSVVFSHIEDYYVKEFLRKINNAPAGSVIYFNENYDRNMQWNMWHLRSQEWWVKNLPNWQLIFLNIERDSYSTGIYGLCVGEKNKIKTHSRGTFLKAVWKLDRFFSFAVRSLRKILKTIKIIK